MKVAFVKATAQWSSKGAGHGAGRKPLPPAAPLRPHMPPLLLLSTETETNVLAISFFNLLPLSSQGLA